MFHNPMTACDYYKLGHMTMDVKGVKQVVSTWTPRHHKHDKVSNQFTVNFGEQWAVRRWFVEFFDEFFHSNFERYAEDFRRKVTPTFNPIYIEPIINAWAKLHKLGYLPIAVWAVPEGYLLADGVPAAMIFNTNDDFGWLPQFLEDLWSLNNWLPATSATTAYYRRVKAAPFYNFSDDATAVRRLCGDFSLRGMTGLEAGAISGAAHGLSFDRSATIDANSLLEEYYDADLQNRPPLFGLPSLEHSVVEKGVAYFKDQLMSGKASQDMKYAPYILLAVEKNWEINLIAEMCFMIYIMTEVQPTGNFTYVSDTYDFWGVIGEILPMIKEVIIERDGKLIIRPDSGDPVKVILGDAESTNRVTNLGALESLAWIFGTTKNKKGARVLNSHIGLIYGDAITAERQDSILEGMAQKGFAPENISLGIGAYTYQFVTRDTRGFAIKATNCVIDGIGELPIYKEPKTDNSKKSQRGAVVVAVADDKNEIDVFVDGLTLDAALNDVNQLMRPIFIDGKCLNQESIYIIRDRLWKGAF